MMAGFPRTKIADLDISRMLIGTNWFLGFSHTSEAKDKQIHALTASQVADVLVVFTNAGVDGMVGFRGEGSKIVDATNEAEQRTGRAIHRISSPHFDLAGTSEAEARNEAVLDELAELNTKVCLPHQCTTDALLDKRAGVIRDMDRICAMIRERGMIPGLSTHRPEAISIADDTGLDVETYISIYNAVGFLMPIEIGLVCHMIANAKKPVITIKPFAAGRIHPFVGLAFSWSTIRPQDMVTVGAHTPDEAKELIDWSYLQFERIKAVAESGMTPAV